MNEFLLDTNVPSELVRPQPDPKIMAWIDAQSLDDLYVSVISFGEWRKGTTILEPGKRRTELEAWIDDDVAKMFAGRILPMTQNIAERWGVLEGRRQLIGRPLQVPDAQIAATALEYNLTLVTRNVRDFEGLGVAILNLWASA